MYSVHQRIEIVFRPSGNFLGHIQIQVIKIAIHIPKQLKTKTI